MPVGHPSSFPPLPNPFLTAPHKARGKGGLGPSSGPTISGRAARNATVLFGVSETGLVDVCADG